MQEECQLLQLPSEIRNRIYELILLNDSNVVDVRKAYKTPPLLSTCHQIYNEAGSLYYSNAIFSVKAERGGDHEFVHRSATGLCIHWLATRAFGASEHVKRVRLDLYSAGSSGTSVRHRYPNVVCMRAHGLLRHVGWMDVWKPIALQIVRDKIASLGLGKNIQVDAIDSASGLIGRMY